MNMRDAMDRMSHLLKSSPTSELSRIARDVHAAILEFLRDAPVSAQKAAYLQHASQFIQQVAYHADREEAAQCAEQYRAFEGAVNLYASTGHVYLLRHPEKETTGLRSLTDHGVRQAKHFAEQVERELLLSPKKVRVIICTSEIKRTAVFAAIIDHIGNSVRSGAKVDIVQAQDKRLFFGPSPQRFKELYAATQQRLGAEEGDFEIVREWIAQRGELGELIRQGNLRDLWRAKDDMREFADESLRNVAAQDQHTIVIGITHSMVFAAWLLNRFSEAEVGQMIPHTAEFAKIEQNGFYYRGRWY